MTHAAVSQLKASVSEYLSRVKAGEEILITDRGKPIAKIIPLQRSGDMMDNRMSHLERIGLARVGKGQMPEEIWASPVAQDSAGLDASSFAPAPAGDTPAYRINTRDFCTGRDRNLPAQDPATYPKPVPPVKTERLPKISSRQISSLEGSGNLVLNRGWEMADAWTVQTTPEQISKPGFVSAISCSIN